MSELSQGPFSRFGPSVSEALKARFLDRIAENIPLLITILDLSSGQYVYVSQEWEKMTGLSIKSWHEDPTKWVEMVHPEDRDACLALMNTALPEASFSPPPTRILHCDGTIHWIRGWLSPLTDAEGNPTHVVCICDDITHDRATEDKLRDTHLALEQKLRAHSIELERRSEELTRALAELKQTQAQMTEGLALYRQLTPREKEVFDLIVRGEQNKAIASELEIGIATVKVHRAKVMQKMGVNSVAQLAVLAVRSGLLEETAPTSI